MDERLKNQILDSLSYHLDELVDSKNLVEDDEWEDYEKMMNEIEWAINEVKRLY